MSLRSIRRNSLKQKLKTNKIRNTWRVEQIGKYGFNEWLHDYFIPCNGKTSSLNDSMRETLLKMLKTMKEKKK